MFGSIGMPELVIILVIALIIFGPRKLPELGKSLGKSINEFADMYGLHILDANRSLERARARQAVK